ncbi:hypothetical protein QFZ76_009516 [Streptomyces sp. V4I2]|nr:hypothetical protein [Streptomyces sp. V4I2]
MEMRELEYLLAVVDSGGFNRALALARLAAALSPEP